MEHLFRLADQAGEDLQESLGHMTDEPGVFRHANGEVQKYHSPTEIRSWLEAAEIHVDRLEKILYPWALASANGWGDYPGEPELWDWYVMGSR